MKAKHSDPAISIIIPHLNQPDDLRRCLRSIQSQRSSLTRVEVIVVDNGSMSLPTGICQYFGNVRLEHEATPGPGPARNKGIRFANGKLLAFIDADCIADANWLAVIEAAFSDASLHIAGGDVQVARDDPANPTMIEAYESVFGYRQKNYIERQGFSGTGNLAMRRAAFEAVGPFGGIDLAEDREWGHRATQLGYTIRYLPTMIVFHPARKALTELYAKWDRHIGHDFTQQIIGRWSKVKWAIRAFAIGCSPILELPRILRSKRITSWNERFQTTAVLIKVRLYRSRKMLELLSTGIQPNLTSSWNRAAGQLETSETRSLI